MSTVALSKRPFELLDDPSGGAAMTSNTNFHQQHGDGVENINGAYFGYSPSKRCRGGAWSPQPSTPPSQLHQQQQQQQHPHPQHATAPSTPTATLDASSPVHRSPTRLFPTTQHDSVFRSTGETFALSAEDVDRLLPNRKRVRAFQQQPLSPSSPTLASSSSSSSSSSSAKVPTVAAAGPSVARADLPLFTMEQVKAIVSKAVQERELQLRAEYDVILRDKLTEQFENFTKFNQDYISRQMRESQWDYML